jgi:hypothetical protein
MVVPFLEVSAESPQQCSKDLDPHGQPIVRASRRGAIPMIFLQQESIANEICQEVLRRKPDSNAQLLENDFWNAAVDNGVLDPSSNVP